MRSYSHTLHGRFIWTRKKSLLLSVLILFTMFLSLDLIYAFDDGFFWFNANYTIDYGIAGSGLTSGFTINDAGIVGNGPDTLSVTVQSKTTLSTVIETLNLVLDETIADTGNFVVDHLVFMDQESEFAIGDTALITIEDNCDEAGEPGPGQNGNCDPLIIETLSGVLGDSVKISSDSTAPGFIEIDLIETGPNTGIFTRQLTFCNSPCISDAVNAILEVSPGDVFTVEDQHTFSLTNGLISGNPNKFAIIVEEGGTVEATATTLFGSVIDNLTCTGTWDIPTQTCTVTDIITIDPAGAPWVGRGSGGLVRPGLVVDSVSGNSGNSNNLGGSGCNDCTPPTLGVDSNFKRIVTNGFSYNENPVNVDFYYTSYPLVKVNVGQENKVVLKVYENSGTQNIEHIGLGFGLGKGESFSDSKATINLDMTWDGKEVVSTFDPEHVLDNVHIQSEKGNCDGSIQIQCMIFTIYHTFRSPLKFNMIATYVWDFNGNSWQNYYNHGIHIVGESINPPKTQSIAFGSKEMRGLFTLTQIEMLEDKWIDEFGNIYINMGNDRFEKIYSVPKEILPDSVTMHGCDRLCNWFESYKEYQNRLAKVELSNILLGKEIINDDKGFTAYPTFERFSKSEDRILQDRITNEIKDATKLFERSFDVKRNF